jgi:hypothetical protein
MRKAFLTAPPAQQRSLEETRVLPVSHLAVSYANRCAESDASSNIVYDAEKW